MILFKKDWDAYPEAFPDWNSKNKSFVRLAGLYKSMGIENHAMILALHDKELLHIDPYDENLEEEQIVRVVTECKINPWYFFREIARAPAITGTEATLFRANRGNIALYWLFFNHITTLLIQVRQSGKSFSTDTLMTLLLHIMVSNTSINLLTKDDDLRTKNIQRLKDIADELPFYVRLKKRGDTNNTEKITVNRLKNTYTSSVAQSSPKAALKIGRGSTFAINHIDEIAFIKNIDITLPALLAASGAARDSAKVANEPYGNIFTTTAGYLNSREGKYVYEKVYQKAMVWTEKLFDVQDQTELEEVIRKNTPGKKLMVLLEFNHRQLGYTDEWLRGKIEDAMAEGDSVLADFLNKWVEGSETSPIDKKLLKMLLDSVVNEPYFELSRSGYITRWYVSESQIKTSMVQRYMIMSLDTSDAVGRDDIAMTLRDIKTGEVLAAGQYNETNLISFSEWLIDWLEEYPNLTMIIERRSSGVAIIDNLLKILPAKGIDPFKRLFNWIVDEADEYPKRIEEVFHNRLEYRDPSIYVKYRKHFGYATSGSGRASRDALYGNTLLASIKYTGAKTRDKHLVDQIAGLTVRNGRIDHKAGSKDDLVISWALGYWFLTNARHKKYYGINENIVLSVVINNELIENGTKDKLEKQQYQMALKEQIDILLEKLRKEKNPIKSNMLSNKIKYLYNDIDTKYIQIVNIENLLETIELEKRKQQHQLRRYY